MPSSIFLVLDRHGEVMRAFSELQRARNYREGFDPRGHIKEVHVDE